MQLKHIRKVCKETNIDLTGIKVKIQRDKTLIDLPYLGSADPTETNSKIPKQINFSDDTIKSITNYEGELILIHNHPKSSTFSPADINLLTKAKSIDTIIASGHDGGVHIASGLKEKFSINKEFNKEAKNIRELGYTEDTAKEKAWKKLSYIYKFIYERR